MRVPVDEEAPRLPNRLKLIEYSSSCPLSAIYTIILRIAHRNCESEAWVFSTTNVILAQPIWAVEFLAFRSHMISDAIDS
jgi:hypothetical protein